MRLRPLLGWACVLTLVAACTDMSGPGGSPVQTVLLVSPAPAAINVGRGDTIQVTFPMAVDSASCAQRFLMHRGDSTGPQVSGRMSFSDGYRHMNFVPDSMMLANQTYFIHIRDSVMASGGMSGMGGGMGGGMMGGQRMMFDKPPAGAMRMSDGMGWMFTTGANQARIP